MTTVSMKKNLYLKFWSPFTNTYPFLLIFGEVARNLCPVFSCDFFMKILIFKKMRLIFQKKSFGNFVMFASASRIKCCEYLWWRSFLQSQSNLIIPLEHLTVLAGCRRPTELSSWNQRSWESILWAMAKIFNTPEIYLKIFWSINSAKFRVIPKCLSPLRTIR